MLQSKRNKVVLITLTDDIYCIGLRRLSAQLKRHGFEVALVFLTPEPFSGQILQRFRPQFDVLTLSESVYRSLFDICEGATIVGMSVWTHQIEQAELITRRLQQEVEGMVVWGGIHPTSFPDQCIEAVDAICLGEADTSLLALAKALRDGRDHRRTPGFWFRDNGRVYKNAVEPLVMDLDELPFLDFEFEDHIINDKGALKPMTVQLMRKYYGAKLWTMFSHGCPYKCTFCSNDLLIDLDADYRKFRKHSADFFMAEIRYIFTRYPHFYEIIIDDDAFMFLPFSVIQEFAEKFRENFDAPFFVSGVIPASIEPEKFDVLMAAGLIKVRVGIQSGNPRIMRDVFVRPLHDDKMIEGSEIAWKNRKKLAPVQYDLIVDNPWEHPDELKDTIRLVHSLKPPYKFALMSLTLLPGTAIYKMGERDGLVDPNQKITLGSFFTFKPTLPNLTMAFYNIRKAPEFWFNYVMKKDFGDRTVTLKQYPRIGFLISFAGALKALFHGLLRRDVSLIPRPLDGWLAPFVVRGCKIPVEPNLDSPTYPFRFALPRKNRETRVSTVERDSNQVTAAAG